ncbi:hypothetical protein Tco_0499182 [Tanacetum coccineum]
MTTLAEFMIIVGADNRPLMLEKSLYDSWKSRMEHYMENMENGRMILNSVQNGPLIWPTVTKEDGNIRTKTYEELFATEKIQADCECKVSDIVLQGLPLDVYAIVNHHKVAKEIWDRVKICSTHQQHECYQYVNESSSSEYKVSELSSTRIESCSIQPTITLEIPLIREAMPQIKMAGLQSNKFRGSKDKVMLPKRPRNAAWFKEKAMLAEVHEAGQILDEEQLEFLADPGIPDGQAVQTTIPNNVAFQTEVLDAYDYDCDDVSNAKAVIMANLSTYGSDVLSEEKANQEKNNESLTAKLERYKERVKTFEQRFNIDLSTREKMIDSQMDDMIKQKIALKQ